MGHKALVMDRQRERENGGRCVEEGPYTGSLKLCTRK